MNDDAQQLEGVDGNDKVTDAMQWQFWIDVGGTFTDCVARAPNGELHRWKTLSSGAIPGRIAGFRPEGRTFQDPQRQDDPENHWAGWDCWFAWANSPIRIVSSQAGKLTLAEPIKAAGPGVGYELRCQAEAPLICIRRLLRLRLDEPIPAVDIRLGTTRGTNALLERKGAKTAFLVTRGFRDLLEIADQDRPDLFALDIQKPRPLSSTVVEIEERIDAQGKVLQALNETAARRELHRLVEQGIESLAICLLHAYCNSEHEERLEAIARKVGFSEISRSSRTAPRIKAVPRAQTTVTDAYLTPILRTWLQKIRDALGAGSSLKLMTSSGGLVDWQQFSGKDSILSGPAGGVVAYSVTSTQAGFPKALGFDMGGTSTDVSRFDGRYDLELETVKAGVRIATPTLAIETVAAGGGSICSFDGAQLHVGPESAGADPGPACYGRGGPLTITDANLALGRIVPDRFPFRLNAEAVHHRLAALCKAIEASPLGRRYEPVELAQGLIDIANETMARSMRQISVRQGYDPSAYALASFGGAGGLHACALARLLGIRSILIHPLAGVFSALGMGLADVRRQRELAVLKPYSGELIAELADSLRDLERQLIAEVRAEGIPLDRIKPPVRSLGLRYQGVDAVLVIEEPDDGDYVAAYERLHRQRFGYVHVGRPLEVASASVLVIGRLPETAFQTTSTVKSVPKPVGETQTWFQGQSLTVPVYLADRFPAQASIAGPAILCQSGSTIWLEPDFTANVRPSGELVIEMTGDNMPSVGRPTSTLDDADPVALEIFNHQFASIAEQMGVTLRNTSLSTNVKERLDYSCALFDSEGGIVVNAPHIPVHLGAMSETVRCLLRDCPDLAPGDVLVTNDPYAGGSHLPDVTVVTPVHDPQTQELLFLTASRAHHAEIGGMTPGSMPPFSKTLGEEGVLIQHFKAIHNGASRFDELRTLLSSGRWPSRNPDDNLADIQAQIAANQMGVRLLLEMVEQFSRARVQQFMKRIQAAAEHKMRQALLSIPDGTYQRTDYLDDGAPIQATIIVQQDQATIDFTGTGPVLASNLNANRGIVTAAVMYAFRCLIPEKIPLNSGVLRPLTLILPECLLNPPVQDRREDCAAVVGGNVETSQRVVDVLLGALEAAAASQGTMNNLTFGNATFGYYETICGGAGATDTAHGADAVHTHMTNTRLTDVEILEHRYPARVEEFAIRTGSGGAGTFRGGHGVRRAIRFLAALDVSLLTQRRGAFAPFGLQGGEAGRPGRNLLLRNGEADAVMLPGSAHVRVEPGDLLIIETPGGGGFGPPA